MSDVVLQRVGSTEGVSATLTARAVAAPDFTQLCKRGWRAPCSLAVGTRSGASRPLWDSTYSASRCPLLRPGRRRGEDASIAT